MIINDPKKLATVIVARLGKGESEQKPEYGDEMTELAKDLLHAVETKSPEGVADAFKALFLACEQEPHEEAGDDET